MKIRTIQRTSQVNTNKRYSRIYVKRVGKAAQDEATEYGAISKLITNALNDAGHAGKARYRSNEGAWFFHGGAIENDNGDVQDFFVEIAA